MGMSINENGEIESTIFKIFPDYHDLHNDEKEKILSALIFWASMEIHKLKNQ